jgi:hypothetical protein
MLGSGFRLSRFNSACGLDAQWGVEVADGLRVGVTESFCVGVELVDDVFEGVEFLAGVS